MDDEEQLDFELQMLKNEDFDEYSTFAFLLSRDFPGERLGLILFNIDTNALREADGPNEERLLSLFECDGDLSELKQISVDGALIGEGHIDARHLLSGINVHFGYLPKHLLTCSHEGFGLFELNGSVSMGGFTVTKIDWLDADSLTGEINEDDLTVLPVEFEMMPFGFDGLAEGVELLIRKNTQALTNDKPRQSSRKIQKK